MKQYKKTNIVSPAYFWGLVFFAVSLPLSKYTMSLASFFLLAVWMGYDVNRDNVFSVKDFFLTCLYGIKSRLMSFWKNKPALWFSMLFFLDILWLWNTSDFNSALVDLRVKLPLLLFPLLFTGLPKINYYLLRKVLMFYLLAILVSTLIGSYLLFSGKFTDIREISPFISSIRLGLNITFGIFILIYFILRDSFFTIWQKLLFGITTLWFVLFLISMESFTALVIIIVIGISWALIGTSKLKNPFWKVILLTGIIAIPFVIGLIVREEVKKAVTSPIINLSDVDKYTKTGNPYVFDTLMGVEDGKYIGAYLSLKELKYSWEKRSKIPFNGLDKNGGKIKQTIIRYLTSKNLRKDSNGINALSLSDIRNIENGVANYNYISHPGIHSRILKIITGYNVYNETGNPSGSSIMQRAEYFKAAAKIIKNHFWTGIGTGDISKIFVNVLSSMHSKLGRKYIFHSHNQYLDIFITYGIFGFLLFIWAILYPPVVLKSYRNFFFLVFYSIMLISMLSDDTIETHAGVSLFAFFSALFMFGYKNNYSLEKY